jgi:hypothetical protein
MIIRSSSSSSSCRCRRAAPRASSALQPRSWTVLGREAAERRAGSGAWTNHRSPESSASPTYRTRSRLSNSVPPGPMRNSAARTIAPVTSDELSHGGSGAP